MFCVFLYVKLVQRIYRFVIGCTNIHNISHATRTGTQTHIETILAPLPSSLPYSIPPSLLPFPPSLLSSHPPRDPGGKFQHLMILYFKKKTETTVCKQGLTLPLQGGDTDFLTLGGSLSVNGTKSPFIIR